MVMDWDSYKEQFISDQTEYAKGTVNWAEDNCSSPIEYIAFTQLDRLFLQFGIMNMAIAPQTKIDKYTVDFVVEHKPMNLNQVTTIIVECDGHEFHEKTKQQVEHDRKRDRHLTKKGYIVLRYPGSEIVKNPSIIYEDVVAVILKKSR